jgi:hypothetical protein
MSLKNKNAKPANQIKEVEENKITTEQHLNNILFGLKKATMSWEEQDQVAASFNHIANLLLKKS